MSSNTNNSWDEIGYGDSQKEQTEGAAGDQFDFADGQSDSRQAQEESVVDVDSAEPESKPKGGSKVGLYAGVAVAALLALGVVGFIGSKVYSIMFPDTGAMAGDPRPLEMPPAGIQAQPAIPGGGEVAQQQPLQQPAQPNETIIATGPTAAAQPPFAIAASQPGAVPPATPANPQPVVTQPAGQACGPDLKPVLAEKDREIESLRADLEALRQKLAAAEKPKKPAVSQAASKPAAAAKTVVAKQDKKPEPAKTESAGAAPAQTVIQSAQMDTPARATASAADEARGQLARYKLRAIYPNTGDFQSAHLVDQVSGKNIVVRVGDIIFGARITGIDGAAFVVKTTLGDIR